jgi:hypothetical protein
MNLFVGRRRRKKEKEKLNREINFVLEKKND